MPTGFVLQLSDKVPPDPQEEVAALQADCEEHGTTCVLTTKPVAYDAYRRGVARVALIRNGDNRLIGHGVLRDVIDFAAHPGLGPAIYGGHHPPNPKRWIRLSDFVAVRPGADIQVLRVWRGGNRPRPGTPVLTSATVPAGQGGQYFKIWHP